MPLAPEPFADAADDRAPATLVEVGAYRSADDGFQHGLVALALGQPFWLLPAEQGYRLMVEPEPAARVREQLACFDRESANWPPPRAAVESHSPRRADLMTPLLWAFITIASFRAQLDDPRWTERGALEAAGIWTRGEWWRPATALFLHGDIAHLVSNVLSGIFVFSAVLGVFGRLRGWLLLVGSAVLGNVAAVAAHHGDDYRSLGASTAVFAALGLLTGGAVRRIWRGGGAGRWRALFAPLASGAVVLALFGAGEMRIDVVAHTTGFVAGVACGLAGAPGAPRP